MDGEGVNVWGLSFSGHAHSLLSQPLKSWLSSAAVCPEVSRIHTFSFKPHSRFRLWQFTADGDRTTTGVTSCETVHARLSVPCECESRYHPNPGVCAAHVLLLASTARGFGARAEFAITEGAKWVQMCLIHRSASVLNVPAAARASSS